MRVNWPNNLIEEIAYRRCVIFVGAGISATAQNDEGISPKKWGEFIKDAIKLINRPSQDKLDFISKMLDQQNYLLALQAIADSCDPGAYAGFLRDAYSRPRYRASPTHQFIKDIDSKIVITTNFDRIYENLCNEYVSANYFETSKIITNMKSSENLIIKAHGTIDDVDNLVFTQKQYYNAKLKHPVFYNILSALFLTNTVIFLGYSLNDPDINLILELAANARSLSSPHYVVVKDGIDEEIKQHWTDCYNIFPLEYGPSYTDLESNIEELRDRVVDFRALKRIP
jgi:hypothetical protein